jgi:hypothetical protein
MKQLSPALILILIIGQSACNPTPDKTSGQKSTADPVSYFTTEQQDSLLKSDLDAALKKDSSSLLAVHVLGTSKENAPYMLGIRTVPGSVEMHEEWDDVAIIRSGHCILKTGNKVTGERKENPEHSGNWVGGIIQDVTERSLAPGDFIIIPALLAHQYIPTPGDSLTYWTIKVKRPKK